MLRNCLWCFLTTYSRVQRVKKTTQCIRNTFTGCHNRCFHNKISRLFRWENLKKKTFHTNVQRKLRGISYISGACLFIAYATKEKIKKDEKPDVENIKRQQQEVENFTSPYASNTVRNVENNAIWSGVFFEVGLGVIGFTASPTLFFQGCLGAVPLLGLVYAFEKLPFQWLKETSSLTERIISELFLSKKTTEILLICVCTGFAEEIAFRGFFYTWLVSNQGFSILQGLLVSSICFGLFHPISPTYVCIASLAGTYFGSLYVLSGQNIFIPAVAHAVYDFVVLEWSRRQLLRKQSHWDSSKVISHDK
eukprot:jgi/Galph1/5815/GphlegSOOS_G4460.1